MDQSPEKSALVLYHANCADGFGAAFAAWLALGKAADYVPMTYGQEPPDVTGKQLYILDFSFEPDALEKLDAKAKSLILLDHHKAAGEKLAGFRCRCGKIHFDMTKCGARLAWEFFHDGKPMPVMLGYIEDRDLWQWKDLNSAGYLAALDAEPTEFEAWLRVSQMDEQDRAAFIARGQAMLDKAESYWRSIARTALPVTVLGAAGLMVNAPQEFRDELGSHLALESGTFGMVWSQVDANRVKVSLRSIKAFECLSLATRMGGGGHATASSFYLPLDKVPALMAGNLD